MYKCFFINILKIRIFNYINNNNNNKYLNSRGNSNVICVITDEVAAGIELMHENHGLRWYFEP